MHGETASLAASGARRPGCSAADPEMPLPEPAQHAVPSKVTELTEGSCRHTGSEITTPPVYHHAVYDEQ